MSLWRRTRTEVAGAWRSVRYDFGRRPSEPAAEGPDVTSTGMSTFGGRPLDEPPAGSGERRHPPRRAVAVTAFGLLTVAGAAGAYFAVVNGLGSVLSETPAAADTFPPAPAVTSHARIGAGRAGPAGPATAPRHPPAAPPPPSNAGTRAAPRPETAP